MSAKSPSVGALIISVDYADYLKKTLAHNKQHFDEVLVVTCDDDKKTQKVCIENDVPFVATDVFWAKNAPFNKAAGLNVGLKHMKSDWICTVDADVQLPSTIKSQFTKLHDPDVIYGISRTVLSEAKEKPKAEATLIHPLTIIGFFTLFNRKSQFFPGCFSEVYTNAAGYDAQFTAHWPYSKRERLVDEDALHYGTRSRFWWGRKSRVSPEKVVPPPDVTAARIPASSIFFVSNNTKDELKHFILNFHTPQGEVRYCLGTVQNSNFFQLPLEYMPKTDDITVSAVAIPEDRPRELIEVKVHVETFS